MKSKMSIEGKLPEGYVILCSGNGSEYTFLQHHLGLSVECPHCGTTSEGAALAMEFYLTNAPASVPATKANVNEVRTVARGDDKLWLIPDRRGQTVARGGSCVSAISQRGS
jgi:hypothetical protein